MVFLFIDIEYIKYYSGVKLQYSLHNITSYNFDSTTFLILTARLMLVKIIEGNL